MVGATGQQGSNLIKAPLTTGHSNLTIRALTRNPDSSLVGPVKRKGVVPCCGDLMDCESLVKALDDVEYAYLVMILEV